MSSDRNEGVSPLFAPALEALLDVPLVMQVRHLAKRGAFQGACGSFEGQNTNYPSSVTCEDCKGIIAKKASKASRRPR